MTIPNFSDLPKEDRVLPQFIFQGKVQFEDNGEWTRIDLPQTDAAERARVLELLKTPFFHSRMLYFFEPAPDGTAVNVKALNVMARLEPAFEKYERWLVDENDQSPFAFPPKNLLEIAPRAAEIASFLPEIGRYFLPRTLCNTIYRSWKPSCEQDEQTGTFIVTKKFIATHKVLFFGRKNRVYARVSPINGSFPSVMVNRSLKKNLRLLPTGAEMPVAHLMNFLSINGIKDSDGTLLVDKDSIPNFYSYNDRYVVEPNKNFVAGWYNRDCPDLYRHAPNIDGCCNWFGIRLAYFSNQLVEISWNATFIDDSMTDEEIRIFDKPGSRFSNQAKLKQSAKAGGQEAANALRAEIDNFTRAAQEAIDRNAQKIMHQFLVTHPFFAKEPVSKDDNPNLTVEELAALVAEPQGLDCGFLYFAPKGELRDKVKTLAEIDNKYSKDGSIELSLPWNGQSTSVKGEIARVAATLLKQNEGIDLHHWTVLD